MYHGGGAWEHGFAAQELAQNASDRPEIDALRVVRRAQKNLRSTIPAKRRG